MSELAAVSAFELGILFVVGSLAGWLNVMAAGGSLLTVPALLFLGLPGPVANGTNRIGILLQSALAVLTFFRQGFYDFRLGLSLAGMASLGALGGASVGVRIEGVWFDRLLVAVIVGVMLMMLMPTRKKSNSKQTVVKPQHGIRVSSQRLVLGHVLMVAAGFWGGMIQMGVGFLLMPILHRVLLLDLVRVNMYKVFIVLVYTAVALVVFGLQVEISWRAGLALASGMMLGGWLGVRMTIARGESWIRAVLFIMLTVICARLLFF